MQAWFASQVADAAPVGVTPPSARDVLIVAGSQSGLSSIFRALVGPGQKLLIESRRLAHDLAIDADHGPWSATTTPAKSLPTVAHEERLARPARRRSHRPRPGARAILADRAAETMYVSGVLQAAALDVVTQPG